MVEIGPHLQIEVATCIRALTARKAAGPDDVARIILREGGEALTRNLSELFGMIQTQELTSNNWGEYIIIPIFKKFTEICANYRVA